MLMKLLYTDDLRAQQKASSFLVDFLVDHPHYIAPHLPQMIEYFSTSPPVAFKRNALRFLQNKPLFDELSEEQIGILTDHCFNYLSSQQEPIAVKVFSMTVLQFVTEKYPELRPELSILIEEQLPYGSAGFKSRAKKVLKAINLE